MALSWYYRGGSDNLSRASFDGSNDSDAMNFFFMFQNVTTRGKSGQYKSMEVMCDLHGDAFYFYYEVFVRDVSLRERRR